MDSANPGHMRTMGMRKIRRIGPCCSPSRNWIPCSWLIQRICAEVRPAQNMLHLVRLAKVATIVCRPWSRIKASLASISDRTKVKFSNSEVTIYHGSSDLGFSRVGINCSKNPAVAITMAVASISGYWRSPPNKTRSCCERIRDNPKPMKAVQTRHVSLQRIQSCSSAVRLSKRRPRTARQYSLNLCLGFAEKAPKKSSHSKLCHNKVRQTPPF